MKGRGKIRTVIEHDLCEGRPASYILLHLDRLVGVPPCGHENNHISHYESDTESNADWYCIVASAFNHTSLAAEYRDVRLPR